MNSSNGHGEHALLRRSPHGTTGKLTSIRQAAPSQRRQRRWGQIAIGSILILGAIALYTHWKMLSNNTSQPPVSPVMINTVTANSGDVGVYVEALGTVTPLNTVSLTARVAGQIAKVEYKEGQHVQFGDPLVDIDPAPYQAAVTQAEGQLARDQAQLELAKVNLERYTDLLSKGVISKQEYDGQVATDHQYEGALKLDQGNLDLAKVNLAYCHITSPIDGRVGLRLVDPGNIVQANGTNPLVVITQLQPITVVFTIAEDNLDSVLAQLRKGAKLTVDAYDRSAQTKQASGELLAVDNQIDTTTGTVKIRAIFDNNDFALFPNQFVNVRLLVQTLQGVTLIPSSAIQQNGQTSFVYVIQGNVAHLRNVKPGVTDNGLTQVAGINPGDVVADSSFDKLQDDVKITVAGGKPPLAQKQGNREKQSGKGS
jgi:membrane fusion protein, multidrug efflux system